MKLSRIFPIAAIAACVFAQGLSAQAAKPQLRALMVNMMDDYNSYPVGRYLEERTGYKVNYDMLPKDNWADKLNLIMASAEPYDFINYLHTNNNSLYGEYARRGALVELGPLIDQYGPNIKKAMSDEIWDLVRVNGKIYGIPTPFIHFAGDSIVLRKDWLDKLGLKTPETLGEFTAILKAFRDKDPGGNGQLNIPFTTSTVAPNFVFVPNIVGAFGIANEWNDSKGKLVHEINDPRTKDYIAYIESLYKDNLIDKDFVINQSATIIEKFTSGRAGAMTFTWSAIPSIMDTLAKNKPEAKLVYLKALKGPGGAGFAYRYGIEYMTIIPKSSKNQIETIKYLNAKLDEETFRTMFIGEEGKHYRVENGAYYPILPIFNDERNQANNYKTGAIDGKHELYWQARVRKDPRLYDAYISFNDPSLREAFKLIFDSLIFNSYIL